VYIILILEGKSTGSCVTLPSSEVFVGFHIPSVVNFIYISLNCKVPFTVQLKTRIFFDSLRPARALKHKKNITETKKKSGDDLSK
jgi:hypothetical protein